MDLVKYDPLGWGKRSFKNVLPMVGDIPVKVGRFAGDYLLSKRGFTDLSRAPHENHLPFQVTFDLLLQVSLHESEYTSLLE